MHNIVLISLYIIHIICILVYAFAMMICLLLDNKIIIFAFYHVDQPVHSSFSLSRLHYISVVLLVRITSIRAIIFHIKPLSKQ